MNQFGIRLARHYAERAAAAAVALEGKTRPNLWHYLRWQGWPPGRVGGTW